VKAGTKKSARRAASTRTVIVLDPRKAAELQGRSRFDAHGPSQSQSPLGRRAVNVERKHQDPQPFVLVSAPQIGVTE
jgi:hypothetical protein